MSETTNRDITSNMNDCATAPKSQDKGKARENDTSLSEQQTESGYDNSQQIQMDAPSQDVNNIEALPTNTDIDVLGVQASDNDIMTLMADNDATDMAGDLTDDPSTMSGMHITSPSPPNALVQLVDEAKPKDFFACLGQFPELLMDVALHFSVPSIVRLYHTSKVFYQVINGHISSFLKKYAREHWPESSKIFVFNFYRSLCMPDPVGRDDGLGALRLVPTMRWLQMISHRNRVVRDILALMARQGHRMPITMSNSLKKMWVVMDIASTRRRAMLMHNENFISDNDLYNLQLFFIKLDMRFNDPMDHPDGDDGLRKLMMGQRGLTPLRDLLARKRFLCQMDIVTCMIRYAYTSRAEFAHLPIFGIPPDEIGAGHLEGWGNGLIHLMRPDELVPREAVRRLLKLGQHLVYMMAWGYVDLTTMKNIAVSAEEQYISDDDEQQDLEAGWQSIAGKEDI